NWLVFERRGRLASESLARSTMQKLSQRERLATGEEVSASIAHEVLQPVTGIVGSASAGLRWLTNEKPDLQKVQAMLNQIVVAGHRTAEVIRAVRAVFKQEHKRDDVVLINELITEVVDLVALDLRNERIQLEYSFEDNLPPLMGDRVQLQQVVLNLIVNAI